MKYKHENEKSKLLYIGGQWQESKSQDFIKVDNPATEEILGEIVDATAEEVNQAVAVAREGLSVARQIEAGNVYINRASKSPKVPFVGCKASGLGREVDLYGMEDYLEIKAIIEGK